MISSEPFSLPIIPVAAQGGDSNTMKEFLQPTTIIDSDHPAIVATAANLAGDLTDDEEIARRCFLWVRDNIPHTPDSSRHLCSL
jgi:transglutaminase-like putative cysteine protease